MSNIDATANYAGQDPVLTAKRDAQSLASWATQTIGTMLAQGSSTEPASGEGEPLEHTIGFILDDEPGTVIVRVWGTQQQLDNAVTAMKDAITDAGGTITSG